jgi:hypothetical protein
MRALHLADALQLRHVQSVRLVLCLSLPGHAVGPGEEIGILNHAAAFAFSNNTSLFANPSAVCRRRFE